MKLPTEPIGSIPRPAALIEGLRGFEAGRISQRNCMRCTILPSKTRFSVWKPPDRRSLRMENRPSTALPPIPSMGWRTLAPDGVPISFADGHIRILPRITAGPFRYKTPADVYLDIAQQFAHVPVKQAVISASAMSLLYPQSGIRGYSREQYLDALIAEQEGEIRRCLKKGAHVVQMDFTEGRLSIKLDPTRRLLHSFIDLNNLVLERFSPRGAQAHRGAHVPRRRSLLEPQRGSGLRRAPAELVRAAGDELLYAIGKRT